jgi:demethylmenaquinone methyltransferase/2-methoxy-6-polyprenyl-1,4-benzoquinol methylase
MTVARFLERRRLRVFEAVVAAAHRACRGEPALSLLDVGGGTGLLTEQFGRGVPRCVVLEPSASARRKGSKRRPRLEFVDGVAEKIPLPAGSFDRVIATGSLHHFADPSQGLAEMERVLAPGGRLVIFELYPEKEHGMFRARSPCHKSFVRPEELQKMAEAAGFRKVRTEPASPGFLLVASKAQG